jgi:hypothetical protein
VKSVRLRAWIVAIPLLLLFIASILILLFHSFKKTENVRLLASITQAGVLVETIVLEDVKEPYTVSFYTDDGHFNEILVQYNAIEIIRADCPNQICVHQGRRSAPGIPITCLPHQLIIQVRAQTNREDTISY